MITQYLKRMGLAGLMAGMATSLYAQCNNGDLEYGNLTGWNTWYGDFGTANEMMTPGITALSIQHRTTVEVEPVPVNNNSLLDWHLQNQLLKIFEGNRSIRIGDILPSNATAASAMASYTFTVTNANKNFTFRYALEMEDHGNNIDIQPRFSWFMKLGPGTTTNSAIPISVFDPSWGLYNYTKFSKILPVDPSTEPWWVNGTPPNGATNIWFRQWSCQQYDLTPWVGQQVTIYYRVKDCSQYGHYAYAYIDGLCNTLGPAASFTLPTTACWNPETPIVLDGSASSLEDSYKITIHELPPAGQPNNMATWYEQIFYGTVGQADIRQLYRNANGTTRFACNKTYRVYLNAMNSCGNTNMMYRDITLTCPSVNAGPDKVVCCGAAVSVGAKVLGSTNTFAWTPIPNGAFGSNTSLMSFTPNTQGTYTLTATDVNGCKAFDQVAVRVKNDFTLSVSQTCPPSNSTDWVTACGASLSAVVTEIPCGGVNSVPLNLNDYTFTWYINGQTYTGQTILKPPYNPNYGADGTLTVSNGCFTKTIPFTQTCKRFTGDFPGVIMPNAVNPPSSDPEASIMRISQFGDIPNWYTGAPAAYNAYGYKLMIWNRWGAQDNLVYNSELVIDHTGIEQGQIVWNPDDEIMGGLYVYKLWLYNCSYPGGKLVQWAVGMYCADEGGYHTGPWPENCWFHPVCCDNEIDATEPTYNASGIYTVYIPD